MKPEYESPSTLAPRPFPPSTLPWRALWLAMGVAALAHAAAAHPISLTSGQAVVQANGVDLKIEVMAEDFVLFQGLAPNAQNFLSRQDIESGAARHQEMLLRDFILRDGAGERVPGRAVRVETGDLPAEGWEAGTLMEHTVTFHLQFPLPGPPALLTFQQKFGGEATMVPSTLDLEVRQAGMPFSDSVALTGGGNAESFDFDWTAESRAGESAEEAWRRRREERRKERMGITSYDAVYGFIYITDHEVRAEILIPLTTLESWVEVERKNRDFLEVEEQEKARKKLEEFFCGKNKVAIDGLEVKPTLQRLDFYGVSFKDFALRPAPERLGTLTARVGAILSYSTKGPPSRVEMTWEYFNAAVFAAKTVVYAYNDTRAQAFSAYQPVFVWQSPAKRELPRITALDAGGRPAALSDEQALDIAGTLLRNIYRAFDYHAESDVYDALARSVHGDLLADLYLKIHEGLAMQEQGGAIATVKEVKVTEGAVTHREKEGGFSTRLTWTVEGTVEHWGHIHTRENQYAADFSIQPVENAWKITAMNVTDQKRLRYQISVRSF
jgi:hypothetical protein